MARIRGHYEWEDDDLTPGQKREGGLHQNLYDRDGKLKGNARFVPDLSDEPVVVDLVTTMATDPRMLADDQLAQLASTLAHASLEGPPRNVAHEA